MTAPQNDSRSCSDNANHSRGNEGDDSQEYEDDRQEYGDDTQPIRKDQQPATDSD